eukprot:12107206-Alexandrium_andersonii.AAC.1
MAGAMRGTSARRRARGHCHGPPVPVRAVCPGCGRKPAAGPQVHSVDELCGVDLVRVGPQVHWWAPACCP